MYDRLLCPVLAFAIICFGGRHLRAADSEVAGGLSPDGAYTLKLSSESALSLVKVNTHAEVAKLALQQPRIPDDTAAPCTVVWHGGSRAFAVLDHDNRLSTQLALYAIRDGRAQRLTIPDYTQNALGRVNAVASALPCESRVGQWNGNDLPVLLMFAATNSAGVWKIYHASVNLHYEDTTYPRVKLTEVKILDPEP